MLPFPQIISLEQKYTHHVLDVHDVRSLQQFHHDVIVTRKQPLLLTIWADPPPP